MILSFPSLIVKTSWLKLPVTSEVWGLLWKLLSFCYVLDSKIKTKQNKKTLFQIGKNQMEVRSPVGDITVAIPTSYISNHIQ